MLYDAWGNEIKPQKNPERETLVVASLRDRWSAYPSAGLKPETLASILKEADQGNVWRQAELFEEMEEKDTHLFSILQTRKLAISGLEFEIEPYSEDKQDVKIADFVSGVINELPEFEENLQDMLDAIGKGYSVLELFWDAKGGKNVISRMAFVHPKRITWYDTLTPRITTEENLWKGVEIPPFKTIFHLHKTRSGHPNRQGVLRTCAWMYLFKNYDIKDWLIFAEVFGMPLRLGKYSSTASKEDKEALFTAVQAIGRDAAAVISESTAIEFIEASKNSGRDVFDLLANFCNGEMSKAVLGQTLTTQQGESGSYSLGQVHNEVRKDLLQSDCEMVAKTLRRDMIRPLVGFNFGWEVPLPWFKFHYEEPEDLDKEADKIEKLVRAGVKTIPVAWVHEKFNIPMPEDGEETLAAPQMQPAGTTDFTDYTDKSRKIAMKACPVCLANKDTKGEMPAQQAIDNLVGKTVADAAESLRKNEDAILQALEASGTWEEAQKKLKDLKLDMSEFEKLMEQSTLASLIFGKLTMRKENNAQP